MNETKSLSIRFSPAGIRLGAQLAVPILPGLVAFGLAVGVTAARHGFSFLDNLLMNAFVYAGASQLVAMEMWPHSMTLGAVAALAAVTATVNARLLLMTAALRPWLAGAPAWKVYPLLHLVTDPSWLLALRYRAEGGSDAGVVVGSSALLWAVWVAAVSAGYLAGMQVADPRAFGLDLVMPVFFAAMLVPLWRGPRRATAWLVAGIVALTVDHLLGGWWFIISGAVAGSVVGGFADDAD